MAAMKETKKKNVDITLAKYKVSDSENVHGEFENVCIHNDISHIIMKCYKRKGNMKMTHFYVYKRRSKTTCACAQ